MPDIVEPSSPRDASIRDRRERARRLRGDAEAGNADAALELGDLLWAEGDLDQAERWWRHAEQAGDDLASVRLIGLYRDLGRLDEADKRWRALANRAPDRAVPAPGRLEDIETVVATAVLTTAVAPFVKALLTKAGEDTYAAARARLRRLFGRGRPGKSNHGQGRGKLLIIEDPDPKLNLALHLGIDTPDEALKALADLDLNAIASKERRGKTAKIRLSWDPATGAWRPLDS